MLRQGVARCGAGLSSMRAARVRLPPRMSMLRAVPRIKLNYGIYLARSAVRVSQWYVIYMVS